MTFLYYIVYFILLLGCFTRQYLKRPKSLRGIWLRERLGYYQPSSHNIPKKRIWVHAVSVGEVISSAPLINKLIPDYDITLSVITDTGREVAYNKLPSTVDIRYLPFDLPFAINRSLKTVRPDILIIIETEIWPCLISSAHKAGVSILLLNGRISEKSFNRYKRLGFYLRGILSKVSFFGMQNDLYKTRIIQLGAIKTSVQSLGNFKFDTPPHGDIPEWTKGLNSKVDIQTELKGSKTPIIVAGSTHPSEEEIILKAYIELKAVFKDLILILAPRHPQRFKEVEGIISELSLEYNLRSAVKDGQGSDCGVILLDTIGELASVYGAADVCILGGSFVPIGGHNLLEPASWGKPTVCGQYMDNFPMTDEFVRGGAVWIVDSNTLVEKISVLLWDRNLRQKMGERALELFNKQSGAVNRAVEIIGSFVLKNS